MNGETQQSNTSSSAPKDTNKNVVMGRPTKYRPEMVQEVDKYLEYVANTKKQLPTLEGFAEWLHVDVDSVVGWAEKRLKDANGQPTKVLARPDFFGAIKRIRSLQKNQLINDGMYNKEANPTMAIFLLKVNHGMVETQYTDITSKGKQLEVTPILGGTTHVSSNNSNQ